MNQGSARNCGAIIFWHHCVRLISLVGLAGIGFAESSLKEENPLIMPSPGACQLRVLSPTLLELTLVSTKPPDPAHVSQWDFVDENQQLHLPEATEFTVTVGERRLLVDRIGFKRRALYAPLKHRDLRVGNCIYLRLASPINMTEKPELVEVKNPGARLWPSACRFVATTDPLRYSPAIHVNQSGYLPAFNKKAMVGYYLGSLGEMDVGSVSLTATVVDAASGKEIYKCKLGPRPDHGYTFSCYQQVLEADFSGLQIPGEYRLQVSGLGASFPFRIDEGLGALMARTYALGLYHQRCGMANELPFTRFVHGPCHVAPAEVPLPAFDRFIASESRDYAQNPRHTAPQLKSAGASLYPFVNQGKVDVSGGHHDAGDYSKYTINSASFIHYLVFAVDTFPGVGGLDNLGLPESGDGKSDLLQEAKWEADFLAKMQDADGGFYFLVYPRNRAYEDNVLPDAGDPQLVWPKNTAATAAAVAALAQTASSPLFKKQFPDESALYLAKAKKGWAFLENAIGRFGKDGSYQKLTHYGNEFMHDDELAWAACEMFLATGDPAYQKRLIESFDPASPATRRWGWWRLCEVYGNAIRSYAFAAKSGRLRREQLDRRMMQGCEAEIAAAADDQFRRSQACAYGSSFPVESKRFRSAGWYFSGDAAFDLAVACQLDYSAQTDPRSRYLDALLGNLNYESGCNPVNVCFLTGVGWKRQREIVHQYATNDRRVLPPSGIPLGNIQSGFGWLDVYKRESGALSYPADGDKAAPYPFYDRWGDGFNLSQEFVILNQARGLAYSAWLMAQTPLARQSWRSGNVQIVISPSKAAVGKTVTASLQSNGLDLREAQVVWEAGGQEPVFGPMFAFLPSGVGPQWVEAEALWPDGRRVSATVVFSVSGAFWR